MQNFDDARAARQSATEFYVKAGAEKYDDLKKLDSEIDAAIKKKEDAEFFELAKKKAFAQATEAQARWKEAEDAPKREAITQIQAALRRTLDQRRGKLSKLSVAVGRWLTVGETSPPGKVPRLSIGLPPPSPSPVRPFSAHDDEERGRRARERRLQFLENMGGPSLLGDLQAAVNMQSPLQVPSSPRSSVQLPHTTSAEVEADRARRAQERRNQFLAMNAGPDALAQLQATLSASASGSPRYGSTPRMSASSASPRSGHMSPSSQYSATGATTPRMPPSPRSASPRTSPPTFNVFAGMGSRATGTSSPALPYSPSSSSSPRHTAQYSTAPRPASMSGTTSPWAPSPPKSRQ